MDWVDELKRLLPPHADQTFDADWTATEAQLGVEIPGDYKAFCATWGNGGQLFQDLVFSGTRERDGVPKFVREARYFTRNYAQLRENWPEKYPLPAGLVDQGMLPFAFTSDGDFVGWIIDERADANDWLVAILEHGSGTPNSTGKTFAAFIIALASGQVPSDMLHPSLLARPAVFEPLPTR